MVRVLDFWPRGPTLNKYFELRRTQCLKVNYLLLVALQPWLRHLNPIHGKGTWSFSLKVCYNITQDINFNSIAIYRNPWFCVLDYKTNKIRNLLTNHYSFQVRVRIKNSGFVNHESISWSYEPKNCKTSIFHESFFLKYHNFKIISADDICLSICLGLN